MRGLVRAWSHLAKGKPTSAFQSRPSAWPFSTELGPKWPERPKTCTRVAVMGVNTPTGLVAARYLKTSKYIDELRIHDKEPLVKATLLDLGDVNTCCDVRGYHGISHAKCALVDADIVLVAVGHGSGVPDSAKLFQQNYAEVAEIIGLIGRYAPSARIVIVSDPVNSMVPFAAEILLSMDKLDFCRLLGSTMDPLLAAAVMADVTGLPADRTIVPVVGGRSQCTAVPVFSRMRPWSNLPDSMRNCVLGGVMDTAKTLWSERACFLSAITEGGYLVRGTAAARTVLALARALQGYDETIFALIRNDILPNHRYTVTEVSLNRDGIKSNLGMPPLHSQEMRSLETALPILLEEVERGEKAGRSFLQQLPKFATA